MKIMRKPLVNSVMVTIISVFYAFVFVLSSGHLEFERILDHSMTQSSTFWNAWNAFLKQGNLKYIGYSYLVFTAAILVISVTRKPDYDEYQTGILEKGLMVSGIAMVLLFLLAFLLILSDHGYAVELVTFLVVAHWSVLLVADLVYVIRQGRP